MTKQLLFILLIITASTSLHTASKVGTFTQKVKLYTSADITEITGIVGILELPKPIIPPTIEPTVGPIGPGPNEQTEKPFEGLNTGGDVFLNPETGSLDSGTTGYIDSGGSTAGRYAIKGPPYNIVQINIKGGNTLNNGANVLTSSLIAFPVSIILDINGHGIVKVGGTITIPNGAPAALYTGVFALIINY